jgi:hypothetical protein
MKKSRLLEIIQEEINATINEIPDFGGKFDQQVADKYGEEETLQDATDEIVDEVLDEMGVKREDLKKDAEKAKEVLKVIRKKVVGKNQDPRVEDALTKQQDFDDSGNLLQANQTNNAILKALGLKKPGKRGRKAAEKKEEEVTSSSPKPAAKKETPKKTSKKEAPSDDEAPSGDAGVEKAARSQDKLIAQFQKEVEPELKDKIKKSKEGDKEAMAWLKSKQDIIKKYNKAKKVEA